MEVVADSFELRFFRLLAPRQVFPREWWLEQALEWAKLFRHRVRTLYNFPPKKKPNVILSRNLRDKGVMQCRRCRTCKSVPRFSKCILMCVLIPRNVFPL